MGRNDPASPQPETKAASRDRAASWAKENAWAIAERRAWIERHGLPLAELQMLTLKE
jgi:antitoxin CcdA